jgi:Uncharacterized conserved protein (COG2071)
MSDLVSVEAVIRRRLLVNFRVRPDVLQETLPPPFRPRLVRSWGMAGICLIGLDNLRPRGVPGVLGLRTENAAHRIAVEWNDDTGQRQGVYIPRRDTNSGLVRALGGRLFPGVYGRGTFSITEDQGFVSVRMDSADDQTSAFVCGRVSDRLAEGSIFESLDDASRFFEVGSLGFSPSADPDRLDGLELVSKWWQVQSLQVDTVESGFFGNPRLFPIGSIEFDSALILRGIPCRWRSRGRIQAEPYQSQGDSAA